MYKMSPSEFHDDAEYFGVAIEFRGEIMSWSKAKALLRGKIGCDEKIYMPALLAYTSASALAEELEAIDIHKEERYA